MKRVQNFVIALLALLLTSNAAFAATTFTSSQAASTVNPRTCENAVCVATGAYAIGAALVVNDVIQMVRVPAGATILEVQLSSDDLDSAGPSIVLDVGDGSVTDRFIDGSLAAQVAANDVISRINQIGGVAYTYTAEDTIDILVQVAPATGASSGTLKLTVFYTMQGLQS